MYMDLERLIHLLGSKDKTKLEEILVSAQVNAEIIRKAAKITKSSTADDIEKGLAYLAAYNKIQFDEEPCDRMPRKISDYCYTEE